MPVRPPPLRHDPDSMLGEPYRLSTGTFSWRLALGLVLALMLFTMLAPVAAWVFVWLAQLLGPFNAWYQGLFPRWPI